MGRLYMTPGELQATPLGVGLAASLSQLSTGQLDLLLMHASQRVDTFCKRRLGAPHTTTVATGGVIAGASVLPVDSTLGFDNLAEQAVTIGTGATSETLPIASGGVQITGSPAAAPYPGTLTLAVPCAFGHGSGEPVIGCYQEVTEAGSASSSDPYTESLQTQAAQLALAHLPPLHTALTRVVFLKAYPIQTLLHVEHAYSFDNAYMDVDMSGITQMAAEGWYRFRVGQVVIPEGVVRTTYTGGYTTIPDDVKDAVTRYVALDFMQLINPYFVQQSTMGKRTLKWDTSKGKHILEIEAEEILKRYKRTV